VLVDFNSNKTVTGNEEFRLHL